MPRPRLPGPACAEARAFSLKDIVCTADRASSAAEIAVSGVARGLIGTFCVQTCAAAAATRRIGGERSFGGSGPRVWLTGCATVASIMRVYVYYVGMRVRRKLHGKISFEKRGREHERDQEAKNFHLRSRDLPLFSTTRCRPRQRRPDQDPPARRKAVGASSQSREMH